MPFVVCQAVTVAIQATAMLINWVATATIKNSTARRESWLVVVPDVAASTMPRTINGPVRIRPDPAATSAPRPAQRQASGRRRAARARQREVAGDIGRIL